MKNEETEKSLKKIEEEKKRKEEESEMEVFKKSLVD